MRFFGFDITRSNWEADYKAQVLTLDQLLRRFDEAFQTLSGVVVTPETATQAPTVQAIITVVGRRLSQLAIHVYRKSMTSNGQEQKELLTNHPVARLLKNPNQNQTRVDYWMDAIKQIVLYGNYYAFKGQGSTGPIRNLQMIPAAHVDPIQNDDLSVNYRVSLSAGDQREYTRRQIHHARLSARNGYKGDSPIQDVRESVALEIAAERFGGSFFGSGAIPLTVFKFVAGKGWNKPEEARKQFIAQFQDAYTGKGRFRTFVLPPAMDLAGQPVSTDNDKAQFLETRKLQRSIIAGAFGIHPYHVGDLERATFQNTEQGSLDLDKGVVLPFAMIFEAAMERDLLTTEDRNSNVVIRFNIDAALRADIKTRADYYKVMRETGAMSPNEIREREKMNPRDGGDTFFDQGPSGQTPQGSQPAAAQPGEEPSSDNGKGRPIQLELIARQM